MKKTAVAVRQLAHAKFLEQSFFHFAAQVTGQHADAQLQVERHKGGPVDFQILARQPEALEKITQLLFELCINGAAAFAIDGDEHRVPASRPAPRRDCALHIGMPL